MEGKQSRNEWSLEGIYKKVIRRVEKRPVKCPVCHRLIMKTSKTNSDIKCPRCREDLAVFSKRGKLIVIPDRRIHKE